MRKSEKAGRVDELVDSKPITELTPEGEQYVIPGCEPKETARGRRPTQTTLWDVDK